MGIIVSVYRDANDDYDCSLNGISRRHTKLCILNVSGPFNPSEDCPAAKLYKAPQGNPVIVPCDNDGVPPIGGMFGGNFAFTSDSRFRQAVHDIAKTHHYGAVPIHDRFEG